MDFQLQRIKSVYPFIKSDFIMGYQAFINNETIKLKSIFKPASITIYFEKFGMEKRRLENLLFKIYEINNVCISPNPAFPLSVQQYLRTDVYEEVSNMEQEFLICLDVHTEKFNRQFSSKITMN